MVAPPDNVQSALRRTIDAPMDVSIRQLRSKRGREPPPQLSRERSSESREAPPQLSRESSIETQVSVEEENCSICLCNLSDDDFGTTHCGHRFHTSCLATWMYKDRRHTCPECRTFIGGAGSRSRMFVPPTSGEETPRPDPTSEGTGKQDGKRPRRFHGG